MANAKAAPSSRAEERGLQRPPVPYLSAFPALPARHLHDPGGHSMAMDVALLQPELRPLVAGLRRDLVADRVQPRRLRGAPPAPLPDREQLDAVREQHILVHELLPVQHRDPAHDRLREPWHDRGMPGGDLRHVHPEHRRGDDPGVHGGNSVRQDEQAEAEDSNVAVLEKRGHLSEGR